MDVKLKKKITVNVIKYCGSGSTGILGKYKTTMNTMKTIRTSHIKKWLLTDLKLKQTLERGLYFEL